DGPNGVSPVWFAIGTNLWLPRNRMRETFTSGSVGRAPGNRCLYPEPDRLQPPLVPRCGFRQQVSFSVRPITEEDVAIKIVILGAGALGSIIGGHLVRAGEEVTLIARGQRAAYLQQHGLTLTGLADFTVPVAVTTQPQTVGEADILVVAVKTYDTEPALASVSHLQVGSVLSIQNGVLKDEQVAHTFGWDKTLGAATFLSGEVTPGGPVRFLVNRS